MARDHEPAALEAFGLQPGCTAKIAETMQTPRIAGPT